MIIVNTKWNNNKMGEDKEPALPPPATAGRVRKSNHENLLFHKERPCGG